MLIMERALCFWKDYAPFLELSFCRCHTERQHSNYLRIRDSSVRQRSVSFGKGCPCTTHCHRHHDWRAKFLRLRLKNSHPLDSFVIKLCTQHGSFLVGSSLKSAGANT